MDMDMALDDLIKKAPKKPRPNKKKAAAGKGKGTPAKKGPGGVKAKVIAKPRRGPKASASAAPRAEPHMQRAAPICDATRAGHAARGPPISPSEGSPGPPDWVKLEPGIRYHC